MSQAHSPPLRDNVKESDWRCCVFLGYDDMTMMLHCCMYASLEGWDGGTALYEDVAGRDLRGLFHHHHLLLLRLLLLPS